MERLTTNKDVSEMSMIELAHNSCYAKDNKARYRNFDSDFDARELAIKLLEKYADVPNEFTCDEDFDDFMLDSLQYGTDTVLGLIAVFYRNLWAMSDLRERLVAYEDIGLLPEQIIEVDRLYAEKCKELAELQKSCLYNLKLPCKVGDRIYRIDTDEKIKSREIKVYDIDNIVILSDGVILLKCDAYDGVICELENIITDKPYLDFYRCFLTQEEAEAALQKINETEESEK